MSKLGREIELMVASLSGNDEQARINLRARQVRERYKQALETVYKKQTPLFLAHTNNVYIMKKRGIKTLIVYVDESIFAAELNAQRELIKLKLLELFQEDVEEFEIHVSKPKYKKNHPYLEGVIHDEPVPAKAPLSEDEEKSVSETAAMVENEKVRKALKNAMTADLQVKKGSLDQYPE